ncbi:MAG: hypothetical protein ACREBJ_09435, partial [Nitrosotalea sp.]
PQPTSQNQGIPPVKPNWYSILENTPECGVIAANLAGTLGVTPNSFSTFTLSNPSSINASQLQNASSNLDLSKALLLSGRANSISNPQLLSSQSVSPILQPSSSEGQQPNQSTAQSMQQQLANAEISYLPAIIGSQGSSLSNSVSSDINNFVGGSSSRQKAFNDALNAAIIAYAQQPQFDVPGTKINPYNLPQDVLNTLQNTVAGINTYLTLLGLLPQIIPFINSSGITQTFENNPITQAQTNPNQFISVPSRLISPLIQGYGGISDPRTPALSRLYDTATAIPFLKGASGVYDALKLAVPFSAINAGLGYFGGQTSPNQIASNIGNSVQSAFALSEPFKLAEPLFRGISGIGKEAPFYIKYPARSLVNGGLGIGFANAQSLATGNGFASPTADLQAAAINAALPFAGDALDTFGPRIRPVPTPLPSEVIDILKAEGLPIGGNFANELQLSNPDVSPSATSLVLKTGRENGEIPLISKLNQG